MELKEGILGRRSVRKFQDTEITKEQIREIVDLARFAPSWKNTQTVRYVVIYDQEMKAKIAENTLGFEYNTKTITRAPAIVLLTSVNGISGYEKDGSFTTSQGTHWQSFDAGIAAQTFMLAAYDLGIATVNLGIFDAEAVKEIAQIPDDQTVATIIAVGVSGVEPGKEAPARKTVDDLVSYREA